LEGLAVDRLRDRVAIVTGAGRGIGQGIARRFASEGARIVVAERDRSHGEATVDQLLATGAEALFVPTDVSKRDHIEAMVAATVKRFGVVDILVNNAQSFTAPAPLEEMTDEMMATSLDGGLWATFWAMRAVFPIMRDHGGGRIINFASLNGVRGAALTGNYNAAKEGIRALTRTAAREWARYDILVNVICPAAASAAWLDYRRRSPDNAAAAEQANPLGRMGDPELDIGGVALFLASEDSRFVTGHTIFADGGAHLGAQVWQPPVRRA
jgi:NAD(P)-dependent dehydrogenase (short-subunit alcohol dehydrogenase family)